MTCIDSTLLERKPARRRTQRVNDLVNKESEVLQKSLGFRTNSTHKWCTKRFNAQTSFSTTIPSKWILRIF